MPARLRKKPRVPRRRASAPMPKPQPAVEEPRKRLRENYETNVAPDRIDEEATPSERNPETSICSLPSEPD